MKYLCLLVCLIHNQFFLGLEFFGLFLIIHGRKISTSIFFWKKLEMFFFHVTWMDIPNHFLININNYCYLELLKLFSIFVSFLFVNSLHQKSHVGKNCDIFQPYKLVISSYNIFFSLPFTWRLPMPDNGHPRMLFTSKNLVLSSVITSN